MEEVKVSVTQNILPTLSVQIVQNSAPVMNAEIVIGGGGGATTVFGDTMTGTGTPADPVNVSEEILQELTNATERTLENASEITSIKDLIPATAAVDNQLVDQGFVNSSIQTATAYFRGDWATWADVPSDPALYPADATGNRTPITNDYMVVIADEKTNGGTWRYKYTGVWAEQGKAGWLEEYQVNETPLTAAQLAALNSNVTAQAVADIATNKSNITALQNGKQDKLTAGDGITIDGTTISATGGGGASLPDQTGNAGKLLITDGTTASWGGGIIRNRVVSLGYNASTAGALYVAALGGNVSFTSSSYGATIIGHGAGVGGTYATAIGCGAVAGAKCAIQLGSSDNYFYPYTNSDANTFKVGNANGNFEMMDASGNVPLGRLTYVTQQIGDISTALTAILGE